jgi:hypothetical protein
MEELEPLFRDGYRLLLQFVEHGCRRADLFHGAHITRESLIKRIY